VRADGRLASFALLYAARRREEVAAAVHTRAASCEAQFLETEAMQGGDDTHGQFGNAGAPPV
jgi:hypothetical protein